MRRAVPLLAGPLVAAGVTVGDAQTSPNGIAVIRGYEDWKVIAPSYRPDKDHIRVGPELKPYGQGPGFVQKCYGCHVPVMDNDFVFTRLAPLPR